MGNFISNFFKNDEVKIKEDTVIDEDVIPLMIQANINTNISEESSLLNENENNMNNMNNKNDLNYLKYKKKYLNTKYKFK